MYLLFCFVVILADALCVVFAVIGFKSGDIVLGYMMSAGAVAILGTLAWEMIPDDAFKRKGTREMGQKPSK